MASGSRPRGARKRKRDHGSTRRTRPGREGSERSLAAGLGELAAEIVEQALGFAAELESAEEAEQCASTLVALWERPEWELPAEVSTGLGIAVVSRLARAGDRRALTILRALAVVAAEPVDRLADAAADGLAAEGLDGPAWLDAVGAAEPVRAVLMRERVYDDGLSVLVELSRPDSTRGAFGVYVDHNLGVMAKDILLAPSIAEVETLTAKAGEESIEFEPTSLGDAAARILAALELTEMTLDPPVSEDFRAYRAYVTAQVLRMPLDAEPPAWPEVSEGEREGLVADFLASPEGARHGDDADALDLATLAVDFCADYVDGRPLRWSPTVVELFMCDWLPRKVVMEEGFFERVPELLGDWIRFAGARRGTAPDAIEETVASVARWREEMLESVGDPGRFGPGKLFALEAARDGVDLANPDALAEYVERRNRAA